MKSNFHSFLWVVPLLKHMYKMRNVIPNYRTRIRATFFNDTQDVNDPLACVCGVGGGGGGGRGVGGGGLVDMLGGKRLIMHTILRGYIFQKLLLAWNFSCINNFFYQRHGYVWPHCCMNILYISYRSLYAPTYNFLAIGSIIIIFLKLIPSLIWLAILWHAGWTLEKTICMNMNYNYLTTIFWSSLTQI